MSHTRAQVIYYGLSSDTLTIYYDYDTAEHIVYYYKPATYDTINSTILLLIHGQDGNVPAIVNVLQAIADRRKCLIVAPTMDKITPPGCTWRGGYMCFQHSSVIPGDYCYNHYWQNIFFNQIYAHALNRAVKSMMPVYFTGFSMGGQVVTRYMLVRQGNLDSMPVKMAVSVNPYSYLFCTDTFNNAPMPFICGLQSGKIYSPFGLCQPSDDGIPDTVPLNFDCNEHVIQYYNENYGALIGTADTASNASGCELAQGANRYERALNFYNFSDTNAITRGTTLQWKYDSVIGVAHDSYAMYNTKRDTADSSTIAETLLFDTPYHNVPSLAPMASFTADTTIVTLPNATVQFTNSSTNATNYLWDFGDGNTGTSVNPLYTYAIADTFTVKLIATSGTGCDNTMIKRNYIIVNNASGISHETYLASHISIYPNPTSGIIQLAIDNSKLAKENIELEIYNVLGEKVTRSVIPNEVRNLIIDLSSQPAGIYFIELKTTERIYHGKVVKE